MSKELFDLHQYTLPRAKYGESGIIKRLADLAGIEEGVSLDFGCIDGYYEGHGDSNTRYLAEFGWRVVLWNPGPAHGICHSEYVTAENINDLLDKYLIPDDLDVLSIDIDGNDFWVWKAMRCRPKIFVIEFNPTLGYEEMKTIPYNPFFTQDATDYVGCSFALIKRFTEERGYRLVTISQGANAIFLRNDIRPDLETPPLPNPPFDVNPWWSKGKDPHNRPWIYPYASL